MQRNDTDPDKSPVQPPRPRDYHQQISSRGGVEQHHMCDSLEQNAVHLDVWSDTKPLRETVSQPCPHAPARFPREAEATVGGMVGVVPDVYESGQAQPVDRTVPAHQGGRLQVPISP
jgi:hypothetical protein